MVVPILMYGSEVCVIGNISNLETYLEITFCNIILTAKTRTSNNDIFIEVTNLCYM